MSQPILNRSIAKVNGIQMFYRDTNVGVQSILCLHGRWGRGETWSDFINRLHRRYRIIAPDQRGHGLSSKSRGPFSSETMAADSEALIQYLGCQPVIVVGHSMGGWIAAYLTAIYPELIKGLVILDENTDGAEAQINPDPSRRFDPLDDGLTRSWPTPYASFQAARDDLRQRFKLASNVDYFLKSLTETVAGYDFMFSRRAMAAIGRSYKSWYHLLPGISCPVLLVRAAESWCLSKEVAGKMQALIRNCTYFEVPDSDHMVYADNPDEFYPRFEMFLEQC